MLKRFMKRWTSLAVAIALILTVLPIIPGKVSAASQPFYFYPDNQELSRLANPDISGGLKPVSYVSSSQVLSITGTYHTLSSDSLSVKVEQMVDNGTTWSPDPNRFFTKSVTALSNTRFDASNLRLYTGFNKITLSGKVNGTDSSDVFYVLYQDAPYLKTLQVNANSSGSQDLNGGASIVFSRPNASLTDPTFRMLAYLQGVAANATRVTVNGNSATPTEDGSFFTPPIQLNPGLNNIDITIENDSSKVQLNRTIYYFDPQSPFVQINMTHTNDAAIPQTAFSEGAFDLWKNGTASKPTFTSGTSGLGDSAKYHIELLAPYANATGNLVVTADVYSAFQQTPGLSQGLTVDQTNTTLLYNETIINDPNGNPAYKYISFDATGYKINGTSSGLQPLDLKVEYKDPVTPATINFTAYNRNLIYNIYRGDTQITNARLLPDYNSGNTPPYNAEPDLNNSEVAGSSFYIKVQTDKALTLANQNKLTAQLLPYSTLPIAVTYIGVDPNAASGEYKYIYQVSGLPEGSQQIQFKYAGLQSSYKATVNFVSKTHITIDNVYDGQTFDIDSSNPTSPVTITGEYAGFTSPPQNVSLSVNGIDVSKFVPTPITFNVYATADPSTFSFTQNIPLALGTAYGLYYGENTIILSGTDKDSVNGITRIITKKIRIYIIDQNVPVLLKATPLDYPANNQWLPVDQALQAPLQKFIFDSTNNKFVGKEKIYDLGFQGTGAKSALITMNGSTILQIDFDATANTYNVIQNPNGYTIDFSGASGTFSLRIRGLQHPNAGSQIFAIKLTNNAGATVTQKVEIERQLSDIFIYAPVENQGNRIVVNKNFVLFDIGAEKADSVLVDGNPAVKRSDVEDRYVYTYIGLKPDKDQTIKITVKRPGGTTVTATKTVYYTSTVQKGSAYMEKMSTKFSMFNKGLTLTFPKGTVLKTTADPNDPNPPQPQYYDRNNLMFGIANPADGVVQKVNDYGQILGQPDSRLTLGSNGNPQYSIPLNGNLSTYFSSPSNHSKFSTISPIYWIHGGLAESKVFPVKPATDGLDPYSADGDFMDPILKNRKLIPTNRGQLTLAFDTNTVDAAGTNVTVFFFNDQGEWKNLGGVVDTKKNTITVPFDEFGYYMVAKLRDGYSDVTNHGWARNILEALYAKGIMENARIDEFGTDDNITRGEFTTLLVRALDLPLNYDNNNTFVDVYSGSGALWKYEEIETAARAGIVTGLDNRFFGVNQRITREDAATMIQRAAEYKTQLNDGKLAAALVKTFTDGGDISYYALPAVQVVTKEGIMVGLPNQLVEGQKKQTIRFEPKSNMTRAQAGAIVVRLLQKKTNIFPKNFN